MPLKKILLKPGVNRENTRYTTEGGWYECDKVRFRQGTPEVIGGWERISANTFLGICRSLWTWVTLGGLTLTGVGTNKKFYIEQGTEYFDVTPLRAVATLSGPFTATPGSSVIAVAATAHGGKTGDYVTFFSATGLGGAITAAVLNQTYEMTSTGPDSFTIDVGVQADAGDVGDGGTTYANYEISPGPEYSQPITGWGAGAWSSGTWGNSTSTSTVPLRLWSQSNYGEDLVFGPRGGEIYYWDASVGVRGLNVSITIAAPGVFTTSQAFPDTTALAFSTTGQLPGGLVPGQIYYVVNSVGTTFEVAATPGGVPITTTGTQSGIQSINTHGIPLSSFAGANQVPTVQNFIMVSDASRFVFAFGANTIYTTTQDPMLVRWSDQENITDWEPVATNQAGFVRLSHGSKIVTALQTRQEIVVFTDSSVYSLQYLGPPYVWGSQILGDNISIIGQNSTAVAGNVVYWMGVDKFYYYDGTVKTLRCDLRRHVYNDINLGQGDQVVCGTSEGFNEVWWFYCSMTGPDGTGTPSNPNKIVDRYVTYNYAEDIWTYGSLSRTAWLDSGINPYPIAATYAHNLVNHEYGIDDVTTGEPLPINAYILSSEFDIDDGHNFSFIYRILPDITFRGSTAEHPTVTMSLYPLKNSGSGYTTPGSVGGQDYRDVERFTQLPIETFTGQIFVRVRGRQLAFKIESNQVGTTWQLGAPRIDIKPDGRR